MALQLIFVVETNSKCKSDWIYIKSTIEKFYQFDTANTKFSVVYMNGKGNYANNDKKISDRKNPYKGDTYVIFCFDCDDYYTNTSDKLFLDRAKKYCEDNSYDFVWFYKDIESVYLNKRVYDGEKKKESEKFKRNKLINTVDKSNLCVDSYRNNSSNILKVLDNYLERIT